MIGRISRWSRRRIRILGVTWFLAMVTLAGVARYEYERGEEVRMNEGPLAPGQIMYVNFTYPAWQKLLTLALALGPPMIVNAMLVRSRRRQASFGDEPT